jgi:hypothetical protein
MCLFSKPKILQTSEIQMLVPWAMLESTCRGSTFFLGVDHVVARNCEILSSEVRLSGENSGRRGSCLAASLESAAALLHHFCQHCHAAAAVANSSWSWLCQEVALVHKQLELPTFSFSSLLARRRWPCRAVQIHHHRCTSAQFIAPTVPPRRCAPPGTLALALFD